MNKRVIESKDKQAKKFRKTDEIEQQRAEIERLKLALDKARDEIYDHKAHISYIEEMLPDTLDNAIMLKRIRELTNEERYFVNDCSNLSEIALIAMINKELEHKRFEQFVYDLAFLVTINRNAIGNARILGIKKIITNLEQGIRLSKNKLELNQF